MNTMWDIDVLHYRIQELKESYDRLVFVHKAMLETLKDISRQSRDSNEKTLARMCLEELELND